MSLLKLAPPDLEPPTMPRTSLLTLILSSSPRLVLAPTTFPAVTHFVPVCKDPPNRIDDEGKEWDCNDMDSQIADACAAIGRVLPPCFGNADPYYLRTYRPAQP